MNLSQDLDAVQAQRMGEILFEGIRHAPFGALPKSELEQLILSALLEAQLIRPDEPIFDLATKLQVTQSRVDALMYTHQLRHSGALVKAAEIVEHVQVVELDSGSGQIVLNVEGKYWRDAFINLLKRKRYFTDSSFNRERIVVDADKLLDFLSQEFTVSQLNAEIAKLMKAKAADKRREGFVKFVQDAAKSLGQTVVSNGVQAAVMAAAPTLAQMFLR